MDILKNKATKTYNYTSRYATFPFYYNTEDKKYIYGITNNLRQDTEYTLHTLKESNTLDNLALKYYGRPDLYWVIADFNRIQDPYIDLYENYNFILIPTLSGIRYK